MSRVNDIHASMWAEDDFLDLGPAEKLIYVWAFSNPAVPLSGIFETGTRAIEFATGLPADTVSQGVDTLCDRRFLVRDGRTIFVRTRAKHLTSKSRSTALNIARDVARLDAESPIRAAFLAQYGEDDGAWNGLLMGALNAKDEDPAPTPRQGVDTVSHPPEGVPEGGDTLRGRSRGRSSSCSTSEEETRERASEPADTAPPLKFDGKPIGAKVESAARTILDEFNAKAGTKLGAVTGRGRISESLRVIVGAIVDHPEITAEVGVAMVDLAFAEPNRFWTGSPAPGVVFGEKVRERNLQAVLGAQGPRPRDPSTKEWQRKLQRDRDELEQRRQENAARILAEQQAQQDGAAS